MDPDTRFSDEEVQKILARAAQRQERADASGDGAHAEMSLVRLQEVAADVGISADHVEAAAHEVVLRREAKSNSLAGIPREIRAVRSAPGTLNDASWERMVADLRRIFKKNGIPSQFGDVREWVSTNDSSDGMPVIVRLQPDGRGGTRIVLEQSLVPATGLIVGLGGGFSAVGVLFGVLVGAGLLDSAAVGFALFMGAMGILGGGAAWLATHVWAQSQQRTIERAADRLELVLRS